MPITILPGLVLDDGEIAWSAHRASGPGGQNVNKVSTAMELRLDLARAGSLPEGMRARALRLAGRRATQDGVLVIQAQSFRTQERNRADAILRLVALLRAAAAPPRVRRATRPTLGAKRERVDAKTRRGATKRLRGRPDEG